MPFIIDDLFEVKQLAYRKLINEKYNDIIALPANKKLKEATVYLTEAQQNSLDE